MIRGILKKLYQSIPFKKQLFKLLRRFGLSENLYKHLHFKGAFEVEIDKNHRFKIHHIGVKVENEIFWNGLYGSWERESLRLWTFLCRESNFIYDIGANTGVYSLIAKTINSTSNVYAFEPVIRVYDKLINNIQLNQFDIESYCIGLSNQDGFADIYDPGGEHLYSVTINKNMLPETKSVKKTQIPISRFDSWFIQNGINGLDLMKIDVETHEPEVIMGMGQLLTKYRPTMIIEVLNETVGGQINSLIDGLGYKIYSIDESRGIKKVQDITKSPSFNYLLCQPSIEQNLIAKGEISN